MAYTRLVSGEDVDEESVEEDGEKYYDDMDEMRAFMRMFMDLVGMFNDIGGAHNAANASSGNRHHHSHNHHCCR